MVGRAGVVVEGGGAGGLALCMLSILNGCPDNAVRTACRCCSESHTDSLTSRAMSRQFLLIPRS